MRYKCESYETKYFIFAEVLDMLAHKMITNEWTQNGTAPTMTFFEIREELSKRVEKTLIKSFSEEQINLWISELSWLNLIERVSERTVNSVVKLTGKGFEYYQNQTFQKMAADLSEARASRKLAKTAILIAILSMILTIISIIVKLK